MKIKDIISEAKRRGKIHKQAEHASTGEWIWRDDGTDRNYNLNRIMMAAGMSDGRTDKAVEMDEASWVEKNNVARPYTEAEHMMMKAAFNTVSSNVKHSIPDHRSLETDDVHKHSAVPHNSGARRNKPKN